MEAMRDELRIGETAKEKNERYNKPCPFNSEIMCVQMPEEECGCDPCEDCENKTGGISDESGT